jgi:cation transport protein ChaC
VTAATPAASHWVFGYGSLIWNPGFPFVRQLRATLAGAHRQLCVYSYRHRGTETQPGLVFGLMPGGSCRGMAFEVALENWDAVHAYLMEREMDRGVYREAMRPLKLQDGRRVTGLAFLADPRHVQYAGKLDIAEQLRLVQAGVGESGPNPEYVLATARHLRALGIADHGLEALVEALGGIDLPVVETV